MIAKILIASLVAAAVAFVLFARRGTISGEEARALVSSGARLVDVRSKEEFATGHVQGAVNIPVQELDRRIAELDDKDQPIVVYCRSGVRSARAARILESAGYRNIHNLGGMSRW